MIKDRTEHLFCLFYTGQVNGRWRDISLYRSMLPNKWRRDNKIKISIFCNINGSSGWIHGMLVVTNIRKRETMRYHKTLNREKHHLLGNILAKDIFPKSNQTLSFNYKFARNVEVRRTFLRKRKQNQNFTGLQSEKSRLRENLQSKYLILSANGYKWDGEGKL